MIAVAVFGVIKLHKPSRQIMRLQADCRTVGLLSGVIDCGSLAGAAFMVVSIYAASRPAVSINF